MGNPSDRIHTDMGKFEFASEQARGVTFTRYTTKFCVRFASSFQFLFMHYMVRKVGMSGEILSKVRPMTGDLPVQMIIYGLGFLLFDLVSGINLWNEFIGAISELASRRWALSPSILASA